MNPHLSTIEEFLNLMDINYWINFGMNSINIQNHNGVDRLERMFNDSECDVPHIKYLSFRIESVTINHIIRNEIIGLFAYFNIDEEALKRYVLSAKIKKLKSLT